MPKACLLTLFAMWTSHTWVVEANQEYYWKVHNHANIQLICIKIYIIASNNKTKQNKTKKKKKNQKMTLLWKKSCLDFIGSSKNCISYIVK